jgi:hypothetical protein
VDDREAHLNEPITVTLKRREWMVVVSAARDYNVRVPREQGDGGACLDMIDAALSEQEGNAKPTPCTECGGQGWSGTGWPTAPTCKRCNGTGIEPDAAKSDNQARLP